MYAVCKIFRNKEFLGWNRKRCPRKGFLSSPPSLSLPPSFSFLSPGSSWRGREGVCCHPSRPHPPSLFSFSLRSSLSPFLRRQVGWERTRTSGTHRVMQADQTVLSLRPGGGGGTRGRFLVPRFDSAPGNSGSGIPSSISSDLPSLRPHGGPGGGGFAFGSFKVGSVL